MTIASRLTHIKESLPDTVQLVAVSKFHPASSIKEAYDAGHRLFGENRVQELVSKYNELPKDIIWHLIGHLQTNKVKYIVPFVDTIESVDSIKLLKEIDKEAVKFNRIVNVLLQVHIAEEEHKFGFSLNEIRELLDNGIVKNLSHVRVRGLMGMASFTHDKEQIRNEFKILAELYKDLKSSYFSEDNLFNELSMGMSDDYPIAIEEGSTLIRIGSKIFGLRK